ncbi:MAG: ABC transporter permease [Rhodospirillales bacterium]|nr:ABC transporter permease [Rhodospirillales bacterium]
MESPQLVAARLAAQAALAVARRTACCDLQHRAGEPTAHRGPLDVYQGDADYLYGVPRLGNVGPSLLFAVPFVLSVGRLGFVVAGLLRTPLRVSLFLAALGLSLFMVAGFAWPAEAIPPAIRSVSFLIPSTSAIDGFVKLSQMGAPLSAVTPEFLTLLGLAMFYNAIALVHETSEGRLPAPARP